MRLKVFFGRHKNLKQQNSRCLATTTDAREPNNIRMHNSSPCITTLTPTGVQGCFSLSLSLSRHMVLFRRNKHRKISLVSCLRSRYRPREQEGKEETSGGKLTVFRFCVDRVWVFVLVQSSKDDRLENIVEAKLIKESSKTRSQLLIETLKIELSSSEILIARAAARRRNRNHLWSQVSICKQNKQLDVFHWILLWIFPSLWIRKQVERQWQKEN